MIDLLQMRTFVAVAEELNMTRAAERLHISQSAVSAHVRALESTLDTQLFVRTQRNLELTRIGKLLLKKGRQLLTEATEFSSYARELRGKVEGHIVIGSSSEPANSRIGQIVNGLLARHPLVSVELRAYPSTGTRQGLKTGEVDVGFLVGHSLDVSFTHYRIGTLVYLAAGPAAWKQEIETADWALLASLPWITSNERSVAYTNMLRQLFQERGLEVNTVATFDNSNLARTMLDAGVGLMLMRQEHAEEGLRKGTLAVSPIARVEMPVYLVHVASRRDDPLIRAVLDESSEIWPELKATPV